MDSFLENKFKECYKISSEIVCKYNELYNIMCEFFLEDSSIYEPYIFDIWELILEEYKVYNDLMLVEINNMLKLIEKNMWDEDIIGLRIKSKLLYLKNVYTKIRINKYILKLDIIPDNLEFNMFYSLITFIDIETMKKVKFKLDKLIANNYNDLCFVNSMYKELNEIMFFQAFNNSLTEIIYFNYNMNIDMIPNIDINNLIIFIGEILKLDNDCIFSPDIDFLIELAKITIDRFINDKLDNNPESVLNNLMLIIRFEIIIEYLDAEYLITLLDYCNNLKNDNEFGINHVVNIIKKRIK